MDLAPYAPLPFDRAALDSAAAVEYRAANGGDVVVREGSIHSGGWQLPAGTTVAEAVAFLRADLNATPGAAVTGAVLQARDGALYVTRAYASLNLSKIGPMPLDAEGFSRMPFGTGGAYDASHVRITSTMPELKALVGYDAWVDTSATGTVATPQAFPAS